MNNESERIADFLFEIGTMRKILRAHRQVLLTDDLSDNIASHSYRVTLIGLLLAKMEEVDENKVMKMCLLHDLGEIRSNDHNWTHKRYVKVFDDEIIEEQLGTLPFPNLKDTALEYEKRETKESIVAKDADLLDQILLLREYEWQGNKEASIWLRGKKEEENTNKQLKLLKTNSALELGKAIISKDPSGWWKDLWTSKNR